MGASTAGFPMLLEPIRCPNCQTTDVIKHGKSAEGKQRYRCRNAECTRASLYPERQLPGYLPAVKQQITDMALNRSGFRDTARVLRISPTTVIEALKKYRLLEAVNRPLLESMETPPPVARVVRVDEAEMEKCGAWCSLSGSNDRSGTRLTIAREMSWPMFWLLMKIVPLRP